MSIFKLIKNVYNYFVPDRTINAEEDGVDDVVDDLVVDDVDNVVVDDDERSEDEAYAAELDIQRNERKKAKHEMKKKMNREKFRN